MMMISPTHRLMLMYNISPAHFSAYYRFMLGEFVPALQQFGLHMIYAWQVVSDRYPERQVEFVCEGEHIIKSVLNDEKFLDLEERLKEFTSTYRRKLVRFENRCQV
jgi:hypothetical protein